MTDSPNTPQSLLTAHAELVQKRSEPNLSAGVAASLSRKIRDTEYLAEMHQMTTGETVEYTPWNPPSAAAASLSDKTEEQLSEMLTEAIKTREAATTSGHRAAGTSAIRRLEGELTRRGATFTPWVPARAGRQTISVDDAKVRLSAVERLLASPRIRPSISKLAIRERDTLRTFLGLDESAQDASPVDTGKLLDAVTAQVAADVDAASALDSPKPRRNRSKTAA